MIDTHAHLIDPAFSSDVSEVIENAKKNGLSAVNVMSVNSTNAKEVLNLSSKYSKFVKPFIGLHPDDVVEMYLNGIDIDEELKVLKNLWDNEVYEGIGEIGVDYSITSYLKTEGKITEEEERKINKHQLEVFEEIIKYNSFRNKLFSVHRREIRGKEFEMENCLNDMLSVLSIYDNLNLVFHCYIGKVAVAEKLLRSGYKIGVTNIINYPKNRAFKKGMLELFPRYRTQFLFETDAPYLPPQSRRGTRCEPKDVVDVYEVFI